MAQVERNRKRLRICLSLPGGREWLGGFDYIKNIAYAVNSLPEGIRNDIELIVLCEKSAGTDLHQGLEAAADRLCFLEDVLVRQAFLKRVLLRLIGTVFGKRVLNELLVEGFVGSERVDFIYPRVSGLSSRIGRAYSFLLLGAGLEVPCASWIPDFQHVFYPQFFSAGQLKSRDLSLRQIVSHSDLIVLMSRTAQEHFRKVFPDDVDKTCVLRIRVAPRKEWYDEGPEAAVRKYGLPDRFFLICNQFWKHKNHLAAFKALEMLKRDNVYPSVVCTGEVRDSRDLDYSRLVSESIEKYGIGKQVHLLGIIPKEDQIQLYRKSMAVIQPSLFEGWNASVEEARALGKPIILSDIPVHREQNPPHCIFFNPHSPESLSTILKKSWTSLPPGPDLEEEQTAKKKAANDARELGEEFMEMVKKATSITHK